MDRLAIVLAAGEGVRMNSALPKVMHPICGRPLLEHVLRAVDQVCSQVVVVVGHGRERVTEAYQGRVQFAEQTPDAKGTGHAVRCAIEHLKGRKGPVLVTAGDMPMILPESFGNLQRTVAKGYSAAILTEIVDNPMGYGRIVREGKAVRIVEQKDLSPEQYGISEINASVYCFDAEALLWALPQLTTDNAAGEYYLTDVIGILQGAGHRVTTVPVLEKGECSGINDRAQLADAEKRMRGRINTRVMRGGVTMIDPDHTYIDADVTVGRDTVIYPGSTISAGAVIGAECTILPGCRIQGGEIGNRVKIEASVLVEASVGDDTTVGPFAYLRPGSRIGKKCRVGDFVEIKNSSLDDGAKVSHLTYVGDSDLGKRVNLGCGVVFVNYDGKQKSRSRVEDDAFVGCNVNLISPVTVGRDAYIAAGSTIDQDVPPEALAIARKRQENKPEWVRKRKMEGKL